METVEGWLAQGDYLTLCVELAARGLGFDAPSRRHPAPAASIQHSKKSRSSLTPGTTASRYAAFDPFTTTPVRGVNWDYGPNFGQPSSRFAYTTPRTIRMSFGVRFWKC